MTSYAYGVVSVTDPLEVHVGVEDVEDRPFSVRLGDSYHPSMLFFSRQAAEALVDGLVAVLVVGGDPDAAPF